MSLSSRRAWIEMPKREQKLNLMSSRSPHGERGLKSERWLKGTRKLRRSPHGERGLKYEIIESGAMVQDASLSSRRAWIEIFVVLEHMNMFHIVALLTESVDWNHIYTLSTLKRLCRSPHGERGLKYRLHRNLHQSNQSLSSRRAWIEIEWSDEVIYTVLPSLSSRRAWIEIWGDSGAGKYTYRRSPHGERGLKLLVPALVLPPPMVALLTESVDWNEILDLPTSILVPLSLSSRRAWIEIQW